MCFTIMTNLLKSTWTPRCRKQRMERLQNKHFFPEIMGGGNKNTALYSSIRFSFNSCTKVQWNSANVLLRKSIMQKICIIQRRFLQLTVTRAHRVRKALAENEKRPTRISSRFSIHTAHDKESHFSAQVWKNRFGFEMTRFLITKRPDRF